MWVVIPLHSGYDAFSLDQYGVLHDGRADLSGLRESGGLASPWFSLVIGGSRSKDATRNKGHRY